MAEAIISFGGGGGTTSDELTATRGDVIAGKTAVTSDSDDEAAEGTLVDKVSDTKSVNSWQEQENNYFVDIPQGAYRRKDLNGAGGRVWVEKQRLLNDLGISPGKIATGQKLAGIGGSYTGLGNATQGHVLQGVTFSSAALSNVPGAIPGNGGGTYTPQPWQQTHTCAGSYMYGNVVINPIPAHYLDITQNQSVFLNGVFGTIANHGWMPARYTTINMNIGRESGLTRDTGLLAAKLEGDVIVTQLTYSTGQSGILIMGSIDFSKFRTLYVSLTGVVILNTPTDLRVGITDKNKTWVFNNGWNYEVKKGWQAMSIDISGVTTNGYLYVGTYSTSSASPIVHIHEISLKP